VGDSNTVNNVNIIIMALEGILLVSIAVWYVWIVSQKVGRAHIYRRAPKA